MRIQQISDVHGEFRGYEWDIPRLDSDLVIVGGDIGNGTDGLAWVEQQQQKLGKRIICIAGNHDYYVQDINFIKRKRDIIRKLYPSFLDNESVVIDGIKFICSTLWTDYNLYGQPHVAMDAAAKYMMDHRVIKNVQENRWFSPHDALSLHQEALEFLNTELQTTGPKVVVTHHCPTLNAIASKWLGDNCNPAFTSDLEGFIIERRPILWTCGHVHSGFHCTIGDTLVVANPVGYPKEGNNFNPNLIIEIKDGQAKVLTPFAMELDKTLFGRDYDEESNG